MSVFLLLSSVILPFVDGILRDPQLRREVDQTGGVDDIEDEDCAEQPAERSE